MPSLDANSTQVIEFNQRLHALKQRQRQSLWLAVAGVAVLSLSGIAAMSQTELVYGFWGLSPSLQQLHLPASLDLNAFESVQNPDYFSRLMSWIGWALLKISAAFFGAFILLRIARKFHFFSVRLKSLVLKFVAWLIAFILIWSSLSYVQYQKTEAVQQPYQAFIQYDRNIQNSEIAQYLQRSQPPLVVSDYLLAQTALLHRPVDDAAANAYVQRLINAEQTQADFERYGFKAEQIWSMQHQLYGKSFSPMAKSLDQKARQAQRISTWVAWGLYVLMALSLMATALSYLLARQLKNRRLRIQQVLQQHR